MRAFYLRLLYRVSSPVLWLLAETYGGLVCLRNFLYDRAWLSSYLPECPVICIGNLSVGGTGKTPLLAYVATRLSARVPQRTLWLLSRGYKRRLRGFQYLTSSHTALEIGDEPYLLARKCKDLRVAVDGDRVRAMKRLSLECPSLVLMDDGAQHRALKPSVTLFLTTYQRPFFRDQMMPLGRLREHPRNVARADGVVFTKCPQDLRDSEKDELRAAVRHYTSASFPVFFSSLSYASPVSFAAPMSIDRRILLLTGIADPLPLRTYLNETYEIVVHVQLPDHYAYPITRLCSILHRAKKEKLPIFTTEKDYVKIAERILQSSDLSEWGWFYLPIEMNFRDEQDDFERFLLRAVNEEV